MQAKSAAGREKAVEHIVSEVRILSSESGKECLLVLQNYIKQLTGVFEQAEDLESLEDLHALCSLMQTICK